MKLLLENWRKYIGEASRNLKDKRVMYHIGRRPASPKPAERWGEKGGWTRKWMDEPVPSGVFLTPNPIDVVQHHGVSGNVYIYKVPEWVIKKAGGKHRYDSAGELLISQELWDEAGDEIEFLGKKMGQQELWDSVEPSYFGGRGHRNIKKKPYEVSVSGIAGHQNAEDIIKMLTSEEKQQLLAQLEDKYPVALKDAPFEVEWEKVPGGRKGYRKDFRLGEPRISKNHQELLDLLKKYIDIDKSPPKMFENWRKYLNEVSFSDAKEILDSKRTLKIIKGYRYDREQRDPGLWEWPHWNTQHRNFKNYLLDVVPDDLTDNQKGTSVLWLLKISRENPKVAARFIEGNIFARDPRERNSLETFFHHQRFMPRQDLMQVKTMEDLIDMTDTAKEEIRKAQEKKSYLDAEQGTEVFRDDDKWTIAALHNKGAACEFGKNTDWCTAAPGLDYFEDYYKEEDPLFYFQNKSNLNKFQFHYGSSQFMDSKDQRLTGESFEVLHDLLTQTEAYNKYEMLRIFDLKRMVKIRLVDKPRYIAPLIDEMRKILNSLEDPYGMANLLAEMATMDHFNIPTYILRWLASEEFYEYTGVARRIVKYHEVVPSNILKDIAENNPQQRTRDMAFNVLQKRKDPSHWDYKPEAS